MGTIATLPRRRWRIFAAMKNLDVWYSRLEIESVLEDLAPPVQSRSMVKRTRNALAKARTKDSMTAFSSSRKSLNGDVADR